jgi:hypothetical protein
MPARLAQPEDDNEYTHPPKLGIGIDLAVWQGSDWNRAASLVPIPTPNCHLLNFINLQGIC